MMWIEELVIHSPSFGCFADSINCCIRQELLFVHHVMEEDLMCNLDPVRSAAVAEVNKIRDSGGLKHLEDGLDEIRANAGTEPVDEFLKTLQVDLMR